MSADANSGAPDPRVGDQPTPDAQALRDSEARYRALAKASVDVIYRMSPDWGEMRQLDGRGFLSDTVTPSGSWLERYIHPDDRSFVTNAINEAIRTKRVFELEHRVLRADGTLGWTFSRAVPMLDDEGHVSEWIGAASDVTARKHAEDALRQSEEKYRRLFETFDEGYCLVEIIRDDHGQPVDMRYLEVNSVFERQTGLHDVAGKTHADLGLNIERHWFEKYWRVAQTGVATRFESYHQPTERWYNVFVSRADGPHSGRVALVFYDATDRKRREAQQSVLIAIAEDLSRLTAPDEIMEAVGARLGEFLHLSGCWFNDYDADKNEVVASHGRSNTNVPILRHTFRLADFVDDEFGRASRAGTPFVVCDTTQDDRTNHGNYERLKIGAFAVIPYSRAGTWKGYLSATTVGPREWRADEIELLQEVATRVFPRIERARAEDALRRSEERYRYLFESIDQGFCTIEVLFDAEGRPQDYRFLEVNRAFARQTGIDAAVGRTMREIAPEHEQFWFDIYGRIARSGESLRFEHEAAALERFYEVFAFRIGAPHDNRIAILFNDIRERKRAERALRDSEERQAFFLRLSDALRPLNDAAQVKLTATRLLGEHLGVNRVFYADAQGGHWLVARGYEAGVDPLPDQPFSMSTYGDWIIDGFKAGTRLVVSDMPADARFQESERHAHLALQIGAEIAVPLVKAGELIAMLVIHHARPRVWSEQEIAILGEAAERTWAAVERARTEDALRQSEQRLQRMVNVPGVGVLTFNLSGTLVGANDAFLDLVGYTRAEFEARTFVWRDFTPPEYMEESRRQFERVLTTGLAGPYEKEYFRRDGSRLWLMFVAADAGDGTIVEYAIDISARKRAEAALRESENRRQLALETVDMGTFVWYPLQDRGKPDTRMLALFGLQDGDVLNLAEALATMIHPDDRDTYARAVTKAIDPNGDGRLKAEIRVIHSDESLHWLVITGQTHFEGESPQAVRMYGTATDITERRRADIALRESEERQRFLLELSDALRPLNDAVEIQGAVTRTAMDFFAADRCYYSEIVDGEAIVRRDASREGLSPVVGVYPLSSFPIFKAVIEAGHPFGVGNTHTTDRLDEELRQVCLQLELIAFVNVPVIKAGQPVGIFCVTQSTPREWTSFEMQLAEETAERCWAAVERARAEEALAASEETFRTLFESIDEGVSTFEVIVDERGHAVDTVYLETNAVLYQIFRIPYNIVGKRVREIVPDIQQSWFDRYDRILASGRSERFEEYVPGFDTWLDVHFSRVGGAGSRKIVAVYSDSTERKRREANLAFLAEVSQELVRLTTIEDTTIDALAAKIGRFYAVKQCMFSEHADELETTVASYGWHEEGVRDLKGRYRTRDFLSDELMAALRSGTPFAVSDCQADPRVSAGSYGALGIRSFIIVPLLPDNERQFQISVIDDKVRTWRDDEIELLRELTARIWSRLERARAEASLRISEARLTAAFEALPSGVGIINVDGEFVLSNRELQRYLPSGVVPSRDPARPVRWRGWHADGAIVEPNDFPSARALRGETIVPGVEMLCRQDDGGEIWTQVATVPVRGANGHIIGAATVITDIDRLKRGEAVLRDSQEKLRQLNEQLEDRVRDRTSQIQALFTRLVTAQEEERRRIARDIHDQLGQQMTALRMNIEAWRLQSVGRSELMEQAKRTDRLAEELDQSIDFLTWQLRPAALDHLGLSAALRNLVSGWSERFGVAAEFDMAGVEDVRLPRDVEANLYRIAQEALHNVAKHARATHVIVQLTQQDGYLVLMVEDNGRGVRSPSERGAGPSSGLGMVSMRERAALVGGEFEIESGPNEGTSIYVRIPDPGGHA